MPLQVKQFETGAVRSLDAENVRYDLIPPGPLRRLAATYAEGAKKYTDDNWLKGMPSGDLINHMTRHIELWKSGDTNEDHLAHATWNLFALMHFEMARPELIKKQYAGVSLNDPEFAESEDDNEDAHIPVDDGEVELAQEQPANERDTAILKVVRETQEGSKKR